MISARDGFTIDTDRSRLGVALIHGFPRESYWAQGISRALMENGIGNSLRAGRYEGDRRIGFARAITDYASFCYLADVFVLEGRRGRGLGEWLVQSALRHPALRGPRRWLLGTRDVHRRYAQFGFTPLKAPQIFMEIHWPDVYKEKT